ncbi:hypothetical protein Rcae01_06206 [Novipirellula caenicola]|uniref:Uncharacterized protein n=1 Tax=Novipirellula caenicola TaxID=1536901 RepID=A0ABP9W133_9BACT
MGQKNDQPPTCSIIIFLSAIFLFPSDRVLTQPSTKHFKGVLSHLVATLRQRSVASTERVQTSSGILAAKRSIASLINQAKVDLQENEGQENDQPLTCSITIFLSAIFLFSSDRVLTQLSTKHFKGVLSHLVATLRQRSVASTERVQTSSGILAVKRSIASLINQAKVDLQENVGQENDQPLTCSIIIFLLSSDRVITQPSTKHFHGALSVQLVATFH